MSNQSRPLYVLTILNSANLAVIITTGFFQLQRQRFAEIDAQRINIVDSAGVARLIIPTRNARRV